MASIVDTSVKHAYSSMAGAPAINGTPGSLIAALDALLISGWRAKAVDSAVISSGVCRLNFASGKSAAEFHTVISVSGASPESLNGEQRVTAAANGWVEFKTDLPDGSVSGSISFKMAGLGWEKVFSKTHVAVYRSTDLLSTRAFVRVDDSAGWAARVQLFESMTDVDNGIAPTPQTIAGGYYWHKSTAGDNSGRYWVCVGDRRGFYLAMAAYQSSSAATVANQGVVHYYAGDLNSYRSGDAWGAALTGTPSTGYSDINGCPFQTQVSTGISVQRLASGIGGSAQCFRMIGGVASVGTSGMAGMLGGFPARADNGLHLTKLVLTDGNVDSSPRGTLPGALFALQSGVSSGFGADVRLTAGQGQFAGRQLLSMSCGTPSNTSNIGIAFYDVTGPWR